MEHYDLNEVAKTLSVNKAKVLFTENSHNFTKVAFDVFQLNNSPAESYWILETDPSDGQQYLVAKYSEEGTKEALAEQKWDVLLDKDKKNATLSYKEMPIQRFASQDFGFDNTNAHIFQRTLVDKMNNDKNFVLSFIESQDEIRKQQLKSMFPELF